MGKEVQLAGMRGESGNGLIPIKEVIKRGREKSKPPAGKKNGVTG
jgi:hypothetical protein